MTTMNGTATMNENSPVLRVENLSKTFGSRTLWKGHDFQASGGEIIALRGPSGCGKIDPIVDNRSPHSARQRPHRDRRHGHPYHPASTAQTRPP